jgi:hypothetical protein
MVGDAGQIQEVAGPDVAVVGWIPRRWILPGLRRPRPARIRALTFRKRFALKALHLGLSNHRPPANLVDRLGFLRLLATKEFRGAMTLEQVRLQSDANGKALAILFDEDEHVGYTPYLFYGGGGATRGGRRISRYRRGLIGYPEATTAVVTGDRGVITKTFRFRLDDWGDRLARALVNSPAPDAWVGLRYEIWTNGQFYVEFSGSFIPSQRYYSGWMVQGDHDMANNSVAETLGFFHAGAAAKSPGRVHFLWP